MQVDIERQANGKERQGDRTRDRRQVRKNYRAKGGGGRERGTEGRETGRQMRQSDR